MVADTQQLTSGLAGQLIDDQILTEQQAIAASTQAKKDKLPLIRYLVKNDIASAGKIARSASNRFGLPLFDLDALENEVIPTDLVKEELIRKHHLLPIFRRGNQLYIAVSDPTTSQGLDEIQFHTGLKSIPVVAEEDKLAKLVDTFLESQDQNIADFDDIDLDDLDLEVAVEEQEADVGAADANEAPIVKYVNKILLDAIRKAASDIHFEPYEKLYRVRFRIDGILYEIAKPPVNLATKFAARLKVMSRLDLAERRVPQDGRIKLKLSKTRAIDFRVSTMPTLFGEKIVMRILDPSSAKIGIDKLGYEPFQKDLFMDAIHKPQGLVLVTGPTGSGKTVSLYTALNILNTAERNISTAEDPVEINLEGINQVHVDEKTGITFAKALKAFLRQDPDIVMVGEIRDLETAGIAMKAAQTGHLVLSTLHTNSAPDTLARLANMGVELFNIATTVSLIIAQRLGRRLCPHCKVEDELAIEALIKEGVKQAKDKDVKAYKAVGCERCTKGYKGRIGIYQVMPITEAISKIIMDGGNALDIGAQAESEKVPNLRQSGLTKVLQGITTLSEINRITTG